MSAFEEEFAKLLGIEGGFSNNAKDAGGATRWGVTETVAREAGYKGDMKDLPVDVAQQIAKAKYWDVMRLDDVAAISRGVAHELLDTGYNMGPGTAGRMLQRALNAFNHEGRDYPDLKLDNVLGPTTIAALRSYIAKRGKEGELVLLRCLNSLQGEKFVEICEDRQQNEAFVYGWFLNRVVIA